ncbi:hypothetical protein MVEG_05413 [Podila verticillata NRRL 6337]|nr:hypothetical protein MVEG_05413 [Podila verticillata NRRL 6337]
MVLQLSTSPFVSPKPSSRAVDPSGHSKPASSSSIVRLSFLNNTNNGSSNTSSQVKGLERRRHHHYVQPSSQKPKHGDDQLKLSAHDIFSWSKRLLRLISLTSVVFVILYAPTLKTQGVNHGFGGGTQYLTIVGLITTWICMALGLAVDILQWPGKCLLD